MQLNCIIVEDDEISAKTLLQCIGKTDFLTISAVAPNANQAEKLLNEFQVDIVFLDIEMPGMSGIDLIKKLKIRPYTILTTSRPEYAPDAFELDVQDYIMKPVTYQRFCKAVHKAKIEIENRRLTEANTRSVFLKTSNSYLRLNIEDISYIERSGNNAKIVTTLYRDELSVSMTLQQIKNNLPTSKFVKVNKDVIINIDKVSCIGTDNIIIKGNSIVLENAYRDQLQRYLSI